MSVIRVTESDSGNVLPVRVGDEVTVELKENAATGYVWDIENLSEGLLQRVSDESGLPAQPLPGSAGKFQLHLVAKESGETSIRLKHWRNWEGESSVNSRFQVTLRIAE